MSLFVLRYLSIGESPHLTDIQKMRKTWKLGKKKKGNIIHGSSLQLLRLGRVRPVPLTGLTGHT